MFTRIATIFLLSLSLISCAKNPVTGRSQFMLVSEEKAISASSDAVTTASTKANLGDATMTGFEIEMTALIAENFTLGINAGFLDGVDGFEIEKKEFGKCFGTEEFKEGTTAFLEKR